MKIDRLITIFVISVPLLFIVLYFTSLIIYKNQWNHTFDKSQMEEWFDEINETQNLGDNIYSILDILKKYNYNRTLNIEYFSLVKYHFTGHKSSHRSGLRNYYLETANMLVNKYPKETNTLLNPKLTLAFGLERNLRLEKCVDYYYNNLEINLLTDSLIVVKLNGAKEFSKIYFKKKPQALNENEIITLISAFDMASFKDTVSQDLIKARLKINERILKKKREKLKK